MKEQYLGDIGDYGKFLLLRYLVHNGKIKLGINWYLTGEDDKTDGRKIDYLIRDNGYNFEECVVGHSKPIYKTLGKLVFGNNIKEFIKPKQSEVIEALKKPGNKKYLKERKIEKIENNKKQLFGEKARVKFYSDKIDEKAGNRNNWFAKSKRFLSGSDLIFLDPDNGLTNKENGKDRNKRVFITEIREYFNMGADVVLYHHFQRRKDNEKYVKELLKDVGDKVMTIKYNRGSARLFVFLLHNNSKIGQYLDLFLEIFKNTSSQKQRHFGNKRVI